MFYYLFSKGFNNKIIVIKKFKEQKGLTQLELSHAIGFKLVTIVSCYKI